MVKLYLEQIRSALKLVNLMYEIRLVYNLIISTFIITTFVEGKYNPTINSSHEASFDSVDLSTFTLNELPLLTNLDSFLEIYGKPKRVKMHNAKFIDDIKTYTGTKTRDKFYPFALFIVYKNNHQINYRFEPNNIVYLKELSFANNTKIQGKEIIFSNQTRIEDISDNFPNSYKNKNHFPTPFITKKDDKKTYDCIKLIHHTTIDDNEALEAYLNFIDGKLNKIHLTTIFN